MPNVHDHDVLVLGAGLAGMRAALEASRAGADVALVTKVHPLRSHSNAAQGGINAAIDPGDSWELHAFDTVKGADYLADQDAVEVLCREAPGDIIELEHWGVVFYRNGEGRLGTRAFGGASKARTYFVGDITGQALLATLYDQILKAGVRVYEEWFATTLVCENGACRGLVALEMVTGALHLLRAHAVIVCTGGMGRVYEPSTNALICTGDGMALAYRAGAPLMDMEMVQYHPTTLKGSGFLISEAARGEGAYLVNALGERFMQRYAPHKMELASRDVVSLAETREIAEGRGVEDCVLLDCRHLGRDLILRKLPQIHELALDFAGVDMSDTPVPIRPGMHYIMGGIKTDVHGRTRVPGLYAAGECACVSLHGGNRLGANSLLDTLVFGRHAGRDAAESAARGAPLAVGEELLATERVRLDALLARPAAGETHARMRLELGQTMDAYVAVVRDEAGLRTALQRIGALRERYAHVWVGDKGRVFNQALTFVLELGFMLDCAEATVRSALARTESRGAHYRSDFPQRDDERWLRHVLVVHGQPEPEYLPVTITRWQPEVRTY